MNIMNIDTGRAVLFLWGKNEVTLVYTMGVFDTLKEDKALVKSVYRVIEYAT
jgi:hypothetical protein